jgi:hypothetical protein
MLLHLRFEEDRGLASHSAGEEGEGSHRRIRKVGVKIPSCSSRTGSY